MFKNETNFSDFINHIKNPEHRRVASKFRIGNHNLRIENGRFTILKTPENLRICYHCTLNSVEDEMHFLFRCTFYDDLRNFLFDKVIERDGLFAHFDYHDKVLFLFNNADPHITRLTAAFVFGAMEKRNKTCSLMLISMCFYHYNNYYIHRDIFYCNFYSILFFVYCLL